jgi:hypothetical protein
LYIQLEEARKIREEEELERKLFLEEKEMKLKLKYAPPE